jgi:hypothetical protein
MSEMAIDGRTQHDISMFNIGREALKNTDYNKHIRLFSDATSQTGTKLKQKLLQMRVSSTIIFLLYRYIVITNEGQFNNNISVIPVYCDYK